MNLNAKYILSFFTIVIACTLIFKLFFAFNLQDESMGHYRLETFPIKDSWGYSVYFKNQIIIKQKYLPAVKGRQLILTEDAAEKLGLLVIDKLMNNEFPSISVDEIQELEIK